MVDSFREEKIKFFTRTLFQAPTNSSSTIERKSHFNHFFQYRTINEWMCLCQIWTFLGPSLPPRSEPLEWWAIVVLIGGLAIISGLILLLILCVRKMKDKMRYSHTDIWYLQMNWIVFSVNKTCVVLFFSQTSLFIPQSEMSNCTSEDKDVFFSKECWCRSENENESNHVDQERYTDWESTGAANWSCRCNWNKWSWSTWNTTCCGLIRCMECYVIYNIILTGCSAVVETKQTTVIAERRKFRRWECNWRWWRWGRWFTGRIVRTLSQSAITEKVWSESSKKANLHTEEEDRHRMQLDRRQGQWWDSSIDGCKCNVSEFSKVIVWLLSFVWFCHHNESATCTSGRFQTRVWSSHQHRICGITFKLDFP